MIVFNLTMELDLTSLNFYEVLEMNGGTSDNTSHLSLIIHQ